MHAGPIWSWPSTFLVKTARATGIAAFNTCGALGGFVGPYLIGALSQNGSYSNPMIVFGAFNLFAGCILLGERVDPARPCFTVPHICTASGCVEACMLLLCRPDLHCVWTQACPSRLQQLSLFGLLKVLKIPSIIPASMRSVPPGELAGREEHGRRRPGPARAGVAQDGGRDPA